MAILIHELDVDLSPSAEWSTWVLMVGGLGASGAGSPTVVSPDYGTLQNTTVVLCRVPLGYSVEQLGQVGDR